MAKILVHLNHDPEQPRRAELAFSVAKSAIDNGHKVTFILAGNPRQFLSESAPDNPSNRSVWRAESALQQPVFSFWPDQLSNSSNHLK